MSQSKSASQKRKELLEQRKSDELQNLSIAERLTRRAQRKTISITLADDEGEIVIKMFRPTSKELTKLMKCQVDLTKPETELEATDLMSQILGELCLDDSLDYTFWKEGDYDLADFIEIVNALFGDLVTKAKEIQQAQSFRTDGHGAGSLPDVRVPEQVSP